MPAVAPIVGVVAQAAITGATLSSVLAGALITPAHRFSLTTLKV